MKEQYSTTPARHEANIGEYLGSNVFPHSQGRGRASLRLAVLTMAAMLTAGTAVAQATQATPAPSSKSTATSAAGTAAAQTDKAAAQDENKEVVVLEAVQVYSSSQNLALAAKRQNDRVGSYLSSDALGVLPDDDLGDALSRLAGVNVVGSQVVIRGAEGKLNNIQVDGLSPANVSQDTTLGFGNADTRAFEVDQIPTELVDSVEVIKSMTADLDGDAIGGIVNVRTSNAFDFSKRLLRLKAEYRYKELNRDPGYKTTVTFADRLNDAGTMGIFLNATYLDEENMQSSLSTDYNPAIPGEDENGKPVNVRRIRRIRPNATSRDLQEFNFNGSFDWKIAKSATLHAKAWYSQIDSKRLSNEVRLDNGQSSWSDYDNRGTIDAEKFLDGVTIDAKTNELLAIGSVVNKNIPGTFTPLPGDATDYRQVEELRPIRLMGNTDGTEKRYRFMLSGEVVLPNDADFEFKGSVDQSTYNAFSISNSWEASRPNDTRIWRAYWDQSNPLAPNVTAVLKDVPLGSGGFLDDNLTSSAATRIQRWIVAGWTAEQAQKMLAAGRTGENAPIVIEADGTPVHWWEITDQSRIQELNNINRMNFNRENDLITLQADYRQSFSRNFQIKTGAKLRNEQRITSALSKQWAQDYAVVTNGFGSIFTLADFQDLGSSYPAIRINDDLYAKMAGKFIDPVLVANFQDKNFVDSAGRPYWIPATPDSLRSIAAKNWKGEETIGSAYFMGTWSVGENLTLNAGARYEHTSTDFTWKGSDVEPPIPTDPLSGQVLGTVNLPRARDRSAKTDYDNVLPSAYAVYRLKNQVFRAAISKTLARPDFDDLNPLDINQLFQVWGTFFGDPDADIFIYNPKLKEQTSVNLDLAWEWYYAKGSLFSVTLFQKQLKNFHLDQTVVRPNVPFPVLDQATGRQLDDGNGNLLFNFQDQEIKFAANGADRTIRGGEMSFQQSFADILPAPLDGFGIVVNYTYMEGTETNILFDPDALLRGEFVAKGKSESDGLSGQPKHIVNTQIYWEKRGLSARLAYNYISKFDREVFTAGRDEIQADFTQLDLSVQYRLPRKWTGGRDLRLFFEGRNLNRAREQEYDQIPAYTTYINAPQREFVFGVRGEF